MGCFTHALFFIYISLPNDTSPHFELLRTYQKHTQAKILVFMHGLSEIDGVTENVQHKSFSFRIGAAAGETHNVRQWTAANVVSFQKPN